MSPRISIILSFRNPGADFKLCIQSVFAQTFSDWELLLMDDGSTDGSLEFARSIDDGRVRVFSDGHCLNLNNRLNQLIGLARAPYIARMDADDVMHPERLEKQYRILRESSSTTVVGAGAYSIDAASRVAGLRSMPNRQRQGLAAANSFIHPTVAAATEWFRRRRYSESFIFHRSQDAELWVRASSESTFVTIGEPLLFYREVGTFTLDKYIGTKLGMISLAAKLSRTSSLAAVYAVTLEVAKLWTMTMAGIFGFADRIVSRRYQAIAPARLTAAEGVLADIKAVRLPIAKSRRAVSEEGLRCAR